MRGKWLVAGLAVSLALNLVLVGFFIGAASDPPPWSRARLDASFGLARVLRFLPEERRNALFADEESRDIRRSLGRSMRGMRRHQRAIHEALAAEPFDPQALAAAFAAFRQGMDEAQARNHGLFVRVAAELTSDERDEFRRALTRPMQRRNDRERSAASAEGER